MKLVRCEWAPSLVVEWLCGELEERGIPGPTYAHTLLSLLHHHYCPHPTPTTHTAPPHTSVAATYPHYHHPLSRRHLDDFDLRDLDLDDLLDHTTHPDADLPDLSAFTQQQRGGSRRARKRHKVRQKHRILTSEQLQKVAALQCLMSASDERYDLESLVEELCSRLKTAAENERLNTTNKAPACVKAKSVSLNSVSQESSNDTEEYTSSSTPEEQAERYYAAFPPLSGSSKGQCSHEKAWKSGDAFCSCVWEGRKAMSAPHTEGIPGTNTTKMPRMYRKKYRDKNKKDAEAKQDSLVALSHEEALRHPVSFTWHASGKHKEAQMNECYDTDSASEPERNFERRRKKFVGPLLDEDIGEGYIGDASSRESSEDRDKGEQDSEKPKEEKGDRSQSHSGECRGKNGKEEWECMGDLVLGGSNKDGEGPQGGGGNRLFERGSTSGGTSGSSSDMETQETKSVRQLERKISNTVAQVWGQAGELLGHGRGEHVWDPPAAQEPALYTTVWGFSVPKQQQQELLEQSTQESSTPHPQQSLSSQFIEMQEPLTPDLNGWHHSCSWHPVTCVAEEDSLICSISRQSPFHSLKESLTRDPGSHIGIHNDFEKSIWSDCNANDISGSENVFPSCLEEHKISNDVHEDDDNKNHASEDLEKKLLESFMQLSFENQWGSTLGLENVFTELSISNSNLDCVLEKNNFEEATQDSHTDSDHEKMMALVEDVCNSYESQEESSPNSSLMKDLPSGPIGPHAVLRHTENSGFSMVVPRGKSAESSPSVEPQPDSLLMGLGGNIMSHGSMFESVDSLPPTQDEENLLTSPRTHFRPIRQDSIGSITDDHYEDGTMFIVNSDRPDLPFQRTSSGALFLESDILDGSPKKYMVYKEPVPKLMQGEEERPQVTREKLAAIALVPKFKVVNNEKFCQTEEDSISGVKQQCFRIKLGKIALYDKDHYASKDDGKEPDVFEFQQQDFPDNNSLANIWKSDGDDSSGTRMGNIWQIQREKGSRIAWPCMNDMKTGVPRMVWLEKEGEGATGWSNEGHFEPPQHVLSSRKSEALIIPTSLASLWQQHESSPDSPTIPSSVPSLQDLWTSFNPHIMEDSEHETTGQRYIITNPTTHIPGKYSESGTNLSSVVESGPWSVRAAKETSSSSRRDQIWSKQHLLSGSQQHLHIGDQKRITSLSGHCEAPGACTELKLEVDQEADELLGALRAHTTCSQGQPVCPQVGGYSPRPLHERLRKHSTDKQKGELEGSIEQEDLDDLAPDWELNDGFEWGLQASGAPGGEDYHEIEGEEDEGDCEVLVYENDGVTYTIPVEYLDDSLYDQIFGVAEPSTHRLGGSLPDLPSGHPSTIYFSSDLEDKWKKSGVPYKVQLPRKPRPGRWLPPSRRPCTFFMEGSCRRSDCKFSHDLASITCRFWEEGSCLKGITCPFLHGYPLRRRRNKSEGAVHSEGERADHHSSSFEIDSEMDFPTLGSSCDSKASSADERNCFMSGGHHMAAARKKKRKFITITKNVMGEMKNLEAEKAIHRLPRRDRRRRHTETASETMDLHTTGTSTTTNTTTAATTSTTSTEPPSTHHTLRKAKRHRASASGHDDGTVSDY